MSNNIYKFGIKKFSFEVEFFDETKFEARGEYKESLDSIDFEFKDLRTNSSNVPLTDEHCVELARMFYAQCKVFEETQGNEEDSEYTFDMDTYKK